MEDEEKFLIESFLEASKNTLVFLLIESEGKYQNNQDRAEKIIRTLKEKLYGN